MHKLKNREVPLKKPLKRKKESMRCLNIAKSRETEMKFLGIKHRATFRSDYLNPLLDDGKIAMTIPDKPT